MDVGMISKRYAKALLKYSIKMKAVEEVSQEMKNLVETYFSIPQFSKVMLNPTISDEKRFLLLGAACGDKKVVCNSTGRFFRLVLSNRRSGLMLRIAKSFLQLYQQEQKIQESILTVAVPIDKSLEDKLQNLVEQRTHSNAKMEIKVNPAIIGGFVLEYDTYQLDASLRSQIKKIYSGYASMNESSNNQV